MKLLKRIRDFLLGCPHQNTSWPRHNRQRCWDCAAWRFYMIDGQVGPWRRQAHL